MDPIAALSGIGLELSTAYRAVFHTNYRDLQRIDRESVLQVIFAMALFAATGYLGGRLLVFRGSSKSPVYVRGAVVSTDQQFFADQRLLFAQ